MGYLLPAWIIGAPLVLAIIDWISTPRVRGTYGSATTTRVG